jgi:ubiquinone biosynthesis protein
MSDWDEFLETLQLGALVPAAYEVYRPAVVDGLTFFLENLDADRAIELLAEQAEMPAETPVEHRLVAIARHCPSLHKLGQVLARDRRLPEEFRLLLQHLETMASPLSVERARAMVEAELGPLQALGLYIDEPPLAEASVAIVVPFIAPPDSPAARQRANVGGANGEDGDGWMRGVCKLLKPGIEAKLEEELDMLQRIGALLDERCQAYGLPQIDYEQTFLEVRTLLAREVHLQHEQDHMREARHAYAAMPQVIVPEVFPFSTPRLTAMQRIDGSKVTDVPMLSAGKRHKLANLVVRALIAYPLWSPVDNSLFHADPHAGNLFATPDGRLALLDWSLVGRLPKAHRVALTQILIGALTVDAGRIRHAITGLANGRVDDNALARLVADRVATLNRGVWPGMSWLMGLMDDAVTRARCRFSGDLVVYRKVMQTLDGVIPDVSPACRADRVLTASLMRQLAAEWGERAMTLPFSRQFATHLSNLDLTQLMMSVPLIGSRQWIGFRSKVLRGRRSPAV